VLAVIDYGIGNLRSAVKAMAKVGREASLISDPSQLGSARGIVLPGVGAFGRCAEALDAGGWREPLCEVIGAGVPFLGICVGFQLLYEASEESPGARGLGIFPGEVERLGPGVKLPQIQWNELHLRSESRLLPSGSEGSWMYFVHSFAPPLGEETTAVCEYGGEVAAAVERELVFGCQFHPEKSGDEGLAFLGRFASLAEAC
jgi:imidazole glycerol-phosphate synthase subunit HisH